MTYTTTQKGHSSKRQIVSVVGEKKTGKFQEGSKTLSHTNKKILMKNNDEEEKGREESNFSRFKQVSLRNERNYYH